MTLSFDYRKYQGKFLVIELIYQEDLWSADLGKVEVKLNGEDRRPLSLSSGSILGKNSILIKL